MSKKKHIQINLKKNMKIITTKKTVDGDENYYKLLNYIDEFLEEYTLTTSKDKTFKEFLNN